MDDSAAAVRPAEFFGESMPRQKKFNDTRSRFRDGKPDPSEVDSGCILPASEDAVLIREVRSGAIVQANLPAQELFGRTLPELLGLTLGDLRLPPERVRKNSGERRAKTRLDLPHFRRKSGSIFPADVWITFLSLKRGPCNLMLVRDATKRLREESTRRLERSRDAFMGDIVHELRSPLSVIRGSVESLRSMRQDSESQTVFFNFIENHAKRMSGLVDRLLDFTAAKSGSSSSRPVSVPMAEVMWEIAAAFVPVAKRRRISLTMSIEPGLVVFADPDDLPHIYGNLLDNAIKFTPPGGRVEVLGRSDAGASELSVGDSGPGIPPADLTRIFDRLYRCAGTRGVKGSGLGLAIVRDMVEANRGSIRAENIPGGGAKFTVRLPSPAGGVLAAIPAR